METLRPLGGGGADYVHVSDLGSRTQACLALVALLLIILAILTQGFVLALVICLCGGALFFASWLIRWVLGQPEGPQEMTAIADSIREGSNSFFRRVYGTITKLSLPMAGVVFAIYVMRTPTDDYKNVGRVSLALLTACSFLLGALCSGVAGYVGLWASVRANSRVAAAARNSYNATMQVALRGGAISAVIVISMVVLGVSILFALVTWWFEQSAEDPTSGIHFTKVPLLLVGYGFGASFVALFAQLGGGIFTKAADVGADLVGKVENDIPEDDPRNPAVIADLVGDNVGDCSARGADLFESIAAEIIAAMVLGGTLGQECGMSENEMRGFVLFPLVVHAFDVVVSGFGIVCVRTTDDAAEREDPLLVLKRGYKIALFLGCAAGSC